MCFKTKTVINSGMKPTVRDRIQSLYEQPWVSVAWPTYYVSPRWTAAKFWIGLAKWEL